MRCQAEEVPMSVQFGCWKVDGGKVGPDYVDNVRSVIAPYGPDGGGTYAADGICLIYSAFYTTAESRRDTQPFTSTSGSVYTWDGRLDNRAELAQ